MGRSYSEEEIERGLLVLAESGGNARMASEMVGIPKSTLAQWASKKPERYERIRQERLPKIYERIADEMIDLIREQYHAEKELTARIRETVGDLAPKDAAGALRNVSVSKGIQTEKARLIRGEPSVITEHRDVGQILEAWRRRGWIESTAIEESDPKQIEAKSEEEGK